MAGRNGKRIGIALGEREIWAVLLGKNNSAHARVSVVLDPQNSDVATELERALPELKSELEKGSGGPLEGASAHIVLLPGLADVRLVDLPPTMQKDEAETVLSRDVSRYFLGANRPRVVGVRPPRQERGEAQEYDGPAVKFLAAAVPLDLLEALRSAVAGVEWALRSFSVAHQAWLDAASSIDGTAPSGVVAVVGSTAHVLRLRGSNPESVRHLPLSDPSAVAEAAVGAPGPVLVLADSRGFDAVGTALTRRGATPLRDPGGWPGVGEATAARAPAPGLELVPPSMAGERREKSRRYAVRLGVAAAVLLVASLAVNFWGARRELASVRAERSAIRADVAPLLLARDSLNELETQVSSLVEVSRDSPAWTRSLVELTALLPENTYLTGLFASGDTVELEAAGAEAGVAIQALRESGLFQEIRLQGLVERELEDGETVEERFSLWARLPDSHGTGGGR